MFKLKLLNKNHYINIDENEGNQLQKILDLIFTTSKLLDCDIKISLVPPDSKPKISISHIEITNVSEEICLLITIKQPIPKIKDLILYEICDSVNNKFYSKFITEKFISLLYKIYKIKFVNINESKGDVY